jgi:hypothetical protein
VREGAKIAIADLLGPFQGRLAAQRPLRHGVARARRPLAGCEPRLVHAVTPCPFCAS